MTNKVKPFYIRITDDMTPQMVQDAFDKCVALGAKENEKANDDWVSRLNYFGVCAKDGTYFGFDGGAYAGAKEITLDQLDEWLGLEVEEEWDGEGLPPVGRKVIGTFSHCIDEEEWIIDYITSEVGVYTQVKSGKQFTFDTNAVLLRKPETPEQKSERERLESAYDLYCECVMHGNGGPVGFETFKSSNIVNLTWLRIVERTGYRKQ